MKLHELAITSPTKQAAKVFESYFGNSVPFEQLNRKQARHMLTRVRDLIAEHRRQPAFHTSEQNPAYLKLVVMEQGLASKLSEEMTAAPAAGGVAAPAVNPADMAVQLATKRKEIQDAIKAKQTELQTLQKQLANPMAMGETRQSQRRRLGESEVQQAQVVLASQDMVDQVQKMIEQVTSMQFKDLPALVDQVKNQMGPDQAVRFNQDVTGALTGLTQNLQGSKQQLEGALGVVTGQAPIIPGEELGAAPAPDLAGELPAPEGEEEIDVDMDADIEEPTAGANDLGRARR
jgi:Skp family chaperone for outer membrane proteins